MRGVGGFGVGGERVRGIGLAEAAPAAARVGGRLAIFFVRHLYFFFRHDWGEHPPGIYIYIHMATSH